MVGTFKDPVSAITHFAGFLAAVAGGLVLLLLSAHDGIKLASMAIYGGSLVAVFATSATYHFFDLGDRGNRWLRRLDHAAIFLLIAGTYVPATLHLLGGAWRITLLAVLGGLALAGIVLKMAWIGCPTWLGTSIYLAMGWLGVIPAYIILPQLDGLQLVALFAGAATYSVGAVVFALERPDPFPDWFGHHEVWHIFVLVGAAAHFGFVATLLPAAYPAF
jgi:hemolysin III